MKAPETWVTDRSHPHLFEAMETISHDSGGSAGHKSYRVPEVWAGTVERAEIALAALTEDDRREFAIGEETEMQAIAGRSPALQATCDMLNAFFDEGGWCPVCHGDRQ